MFMPALNCTSKMICATPSDAACWGGTFDLLPRAGEQLTALGAGTLNQADRSSQHDCASLGCFASLPAASFRILDWLASESQLEGPKAFHPSVSCAARISARVACAAW